MHYLFLLNPAAGKKDSTSRVAVGLRVALARAGIPEKDYTIRRTRYKGHALALARDIARTGRPLRIYTAGGDGTFNEALRGAQPYSGAAVGCIPAGSGNDFLRTFGTKEEFRDLDAQLAGGVVSIDLMDTTLGLSAAVCAMGLDAQVAAGASGFRRSWLFYGEAAYLLSAAREICGSVGRRVRFTVDGEQFEADILMCAVCNARDYGGGFRAAPAACPDDGLLDLVAVRKTSRFNVLRLLGSYRQGRHFAGERLDPAVARYFIFRRARRVTVEPIDGGGPMVATADGECAPVEKLDVTLRPLAGRIILPAAPYARFLEQETAVSLK